MKSHKVWKEVANTRDRPLLLPHYPGFSVHGAAPLVLVGV